MTRAKASADAAIEINTKPGSIKAEELLAMFKEVAGAPTKFKEPTLADVLEPCADFIKTALAAEVSVATLAQELEKRKIIAVSPQQLRKIFNVKGWMPVKERKDAAEPASSAAKPVAGAVKSTTPAIASNAVAAKAT